MSGPSKKVPDWRSRILNEFTPKVADLTLVADPDALLLEETLFAAIRERGFEIITFGDSAAFRFAYESGFRSHWDQDESTDLEVVVRVDRQELRTLPYDLLQASRRLSFGLNALFPALSYPVVASLDRSDLDTLYVAQQQHGPKQIGDEATKDFVLLHVFEIAPALIRDSVELLRVLLRRHYRRQVLPPLLDGRIVQVLRQNRAFDAWSLETIVPNREAFFSFLQERWPWFLDCLARKLLGGSEDLGEAPIFDIGGPSSLPFDHDDIHVYIDNLFVDGMLRPVPHRFGGKLSGEWVSVGIRNDPISDRLRRIADLSKVVSTTIPNPEAPHYDWLAFAHRWAELAVLWSETDAAARSEIDARLVDIRTQIDHAFGTWMEHRYAGLHNQPPGRPAMVHHLPHYLSQRLSDVPGSKIALVVVDGLALEQWIVLRDVLTGHRPVFRFHEVAVFAWVPTITSVSRKAIFAGTPPLFFPSSILTTDGEEKLWTRFWGDHGLTATEVGFGKGLGDGIFDDIRDLTSQPGMRVLGLVVDKVDRIMHGMELGAAGMHNQVRQWANEGFMVELLDLLFDAGFTVFLTSDHGNIEATGCGQPFEGAIADLRGERVRIFSDPILRSRVKGRFPSAVEWRRLGLPEDCSPLLAPGRSAFVREGKRIVGHGGISLEEVIVPMVEVQRATA